MPRCNRNKPGDTHDSGLKPGGKRAKSNRKLTERKSSLGFFFLDVFLLVLERGERGGERKKH